MTKKQKNAIILALVGIAIILLSLGSTWADAPL